MADLSPAQRHRIVLEATAPGADLDDVCRRYGVTHQEVTAWHREALHGGVRSGFGWVALPGAALGTTFGLAVLGLGWGLAALAAGLWHVLGEVLGDTTGPLRDIGGMAVAFIGGVGALAALAGFGIVAASVLAGWMGTRNG